MNLKLPERRRFIRIDVPLKVTVKTANRLEKGITINVSPVGLRFEIARKLEESEKLKLALYLPSIDNPVHLETKIVWQRKKSLEDKAPYDVGVEINNIEDSDKNVFLKYLCDLFYNSIYEMRT